MVHGKVRLETIGSVAIMTLNDPAVLNAFGHKLREDMQTAMDRLLAASSLFQALGGGWTPDGKLAALQP